MTATAVEGRACLTCGTFKPWSDFPLGKGTNGRRGHCKPCHSAANVEYNRRNPDKANAATTAWRSRNPEAVAAQKRAWRLANPEKVRAEKRRHSLKHSPHIVARVQAWRKNNPEKVAEYERRRRTRKRNGGGLDYTTLEHVRQRVALYGGICFYCRAAPGVEIDHRIALARGGSHWPANLVPACRSCNARKNAKHPLDFAKEVTLSRPHANDH